MSNEVLAQVLRLVIAANSDKFILTPHQKQVLGVKENRRFETYTDRNGKTVLIAVAPKIIIKENDYE